MAHAEWINATYPDETEVQWALMDLPTFPEIIDQANGRTLIDMAYNLRRNL